MDHVTKSILFHQWQLHFLGFGIRDDLIAKYLAYVERCLQHRVPVIFEFRHLAALLGRTPRYLATAIQSPKSHYRSFTIPKRNGGAREILAPFPALLECQRWICSQILCRARVHSAAMSYRVGRSIKQNAELHAGRGNVLKIDLKDFFPSISLRRVIAVFRRLGYPKRVSFYLGSLCCVDDALPQGGGASPVLSNVICWKLDRRLSRLAKRNGLEYSRYADDIVFSGDVIPSWLLRFVRLILSQEGFQVNDHKTRQWKVGSRKIVTGLDISSSTVRIPKAKRREWRQHAHYVLKYGIVGHANAIRSRKPFLLNSLIGCFEYWHWIEPDDGYVEQTLDRLKALAATGFE